MNPSKLLRREGTSKVVLLVGRDDVRDFYRPIYIYSSSKVSECQRVECTDKQISSECEHVDIMNHSGFFIDNLTLSHTAENLPLELHQLVYHQNV